MRPLLHTVFDALDALLDFIAIAVLALNETRDTLICIRLVVLEQIIGILSVANAAPDAFGERDTSLAVGIARQAGLAIDNAWLRERAGQVAVLEERQHLARELHDWVIRAPYGISLYAEAAEPCACRR